MSKGAERVQTITGNFCLLLQGAHVGDERFDLVVAQLVAEGFHHRLTILLHPFLDGLGGFGVGEARLHSSDR